MIHLCCLSSNIFEFEARDAQSERKKHFNLFQNIFHVVMYVVNDIAKCWDDYQNAFRNQIIRKNQLPSLTSHTYRNN